MNDDDECKHLLPAGTCTICSGKETTLQSTASKIGGSQGALDSPEAIERYRHWYPGDREATFDAYVKVFFDRNEARSFPGGWAKFSSCANAEPAPVRDDPELVAQAESIMLAAGYEPDDSGRPAKGRRWVLAVS